jgi:hypothetical protein
MQFRRFRGSVLAIAVVVGVIGCAASTRIVNEWTNPDYSSPRFGRMLVIAISKNPGIRRTFEDEFVAKLKAAGVDAAPSYRYIPEEGGAHTGSGEAGRCGRSNYHAASAGGKEDRSSPGFYQPAPAVTFGFYPGYSAAWLGYYEPPTILPA